MPQQPLSMYLASVPVLARSLRNLSGVLGKGEANAAERQLDPTVLLGWRLAPDMFPLTRQVQIATDMCKGCVSRLAAVDVPAWEDKETTFGELLDRIEKCVSYLETFTPGQIDGSEERAIVLKLRTGEMTFTGRAYLFDFVLPNVYFHCTTSYAILRSCGVPLGKRDFIGGG